ncbi:MAG: hypothetical protein B1H07_02965 [Campylobacteraceae bacterium 4484_166]|nr:MAG: hypothetical protein B1H07_02965 [Campylobacteraceae bacterium 4484_166]
MKKQGSYKTNCPVSYKDLKIVVVDYLDFDNNIKKGSLIVHKKISKKVQMIFDELLKIGYNIERIEPIYNYQADDYISIKHNNSSAFNCRKIATTNKWSNHAYGLAIDINPLQNPFVSKDGKVTHKGSVNYIQRHKNKKTLHDKAMIDKDSHVVKIFQKYGFKWGGNWKSVKDYQHFEHPKFYK